MVENLTTTKFTYGTSIPVITDPVSCGDLTTQRAYLPEKSGFLVRCIRNYQLIKHLASSEDKWTLVIHYDV
jgi:hypothetical protein